MTPARKALAAVILAVLLFTAVAVQLSVVNRLPLPGGAVPDLVLLLVTAVAVASPPALAAVTGFAGGLALDTAPPASHYAGEYALVFCLAAYAAARVNRAISDRVGERDPVTALTVMAVAAAAGEAGKAALGMLLSDPDVTVAAVSRVLPGAILYDLLLSPFACWLVVLVTSRPASLDTGQERAPVITFSRDQRLASAFRQASAGATAKLRLAGTGAAYRTQPPARRVPELRLSGTRSRTPHRAVPDSSGGSPPPLPAGPAKKLNFAGDLPVRVGARPARAPGKNWLKKAASPAAPVTRQRARGPARGWLGSSRRPRTVISPGLDGHRALSRRLRTVTGPGLAGQRALSRRRALAGGNGRAVPPSGAWLRRSRHPWRKRSQRLLRMMGVGH